MLCKKGLFRLLVGCCSLATVMQAEQFGNMIFTAAPGWTRAPQPDGLAFLLPPKDSPEAATLFLLQDRELNGDFRATFKSIVQSRVKKNERILQRSEPHPFPSVAGAENLFEILVIQDAGREAIRAYMGFHPGNRIDVVTLAAPNQEMFQRNMLVLKEFLSHLQFADPKSDSSGPRHQQGTRHGLRTRTS